MKLSTKILSLTLCSMLSWTLSARAVPVTVAGYGTWEITTVTTSFDADSALLKSQPWYTGDYNSGSESVAFAFATALGTQINPGLPGYPNAGPLFVWSFNQYYVNTIVDLYFAPDHSQGYYNIGANQVLTYAVATQAGVPDGGATVVLLGIGMVGMLALRRPRFGSSRSNP